MKVSFVNPTDAGSAAVAEVPPLPAPFIDIKATDIVSTVTSVAPSGEVIKEVCNITPAESIPGASTAVVPAPAPSVPATTPHSFDDEDIGFDDVILPRLNIVQKVGDLSNVYTPGEILLNQTLPIYTAPIINDGVVVKPGTAPLNLTVIGFKKKQFVEKIAGGAQGAFVNTLAEVAALGGTLDYKEHSEKTKLQIPCRLFQHYATALVLVQKPDAIADEGHISFPYECEGKYYALCLWGMKGTAYTNGAKQFFTARKIGHLRAGGYPSHSWTLATKLEKYKDNSAHIPVLKASTANTPAFLAFVKDVLGCGK
jgi:hypothetical protein